MNWLRSMLAVAGNESRIMFRDRGALALYLLLPLLIAGLIFGPQIITWDNEDAPSVSFNLAVVDEDEGPYGAAILRVLREIDVLDVTAMGDRARADAAVANREMDAAVAIPRDFSRLIDVHDPAAIELIVDPTQETTVGVLGGILDSVTAEIVLVGEIQYGIRAVMAESTELAAAEPAVREGIAAQTLGVIMTQLNEKRQTPAIAIISQDMSGKTASDLRNVAIVAIMPGMAILVSFFVTTSLISSFYNEQESGSFRRLLAAPLPRSAIIAGKMVTYILVIFLQLGIMMVAANLFFAMPIGDSPLAVALVILALALAVTAVGMFLTAVSRTEKQGSAWAMVAALLLGVLGGCVYTLPVPLVFRTDGLLGTLSRLTPQGNAMDALVSLMAEGARLVDVLPQIGVIMAITGVFYALAVWRFRFA